MHLRGVTLSAFDCRFRQPSGLLEGAIPRLRLGRDLALQVSDLINHRVTFRWHRYGAEKLMLFIKLAEISSFMAARWYKGWYQNEATNAGAPGAGR